MNLLFLFFSGKMMRSYISRTAILILILLAFPSLAIYSQTENIGVKGKDSLAQKEKSVQDTSKIIGAKSSSIFLQKIFFYDDKKFSISREGVENIDYKTIADVFATQPFSFYKNLGSLGTPNQLIFYGQPVYKTSVFINGIETNNRMTSTFSFENIINENVNSLQTLPLSSSFLLGNTNTASVNIIEFQPEIKKPFSRIKFYQGADEEGFFDGIINLSPLKKVITYFELSNQTYAGRYANSEFSSWKGIVRATYLFSEKVNFIVQYSHHNSSSQLYGGVDIDSISKSYGETNIEAVAFESLTSPIRFSNRYMNSISDRLILTSVAKLSENNFTEISAYYQNDEIDFRQNVIGALQNNVFPIKREDFSLTKGMKLRSDFKNDGFDFFILSNFERNQFNSQFLSKQNSLSFFNVAAGSKFYLLNNLITSIYGKFLTQAQETYLGFGGDIFYEANEELNFYAGFSSYKNPLTFYERRFVINKNWKDYSLINNIEARINYHTKPFSISVGYFLTRNDNYLLPAFLVSQFKNDEAYFVKNINSKFDGMNLNVNFNLWKVFLENNLNYYFNEEERYYRGLPEFNFTSSLYYKDILFNKNLDLKTGFKIYSVGNRIEQRFDFEKGISSSFIYDMNLDLLNRISGKNFSPSFQIDFFLIGKIQESATVYITWENLLDSKFYIIPYYPYQLRNFRFGVAWNFLD